MLYQPDFEMNINENSTAWYLSIYDAGFRVDAENLHTLYIEALDLRDPKCVLWKDIVITAAEAVEIYNVSDATIRNYLAWNKPSWARKAKGTWLMLKRYADVQWLDLK